jgi:hypothetical protein
MSAEWAVEARKNPTSVDGIDFNVAEVIQRLVGYEEIAL